MSNSHFERLKEMVGKEEERNCGKCRKERVWLFCRESGGIFSNDKYYWKCTGCGCKDYVER